jgi:hypothetical protein
LSLLLNIKDSSYGRILKPRKRFETQEVFFPLSKQPKAVGSNLQDLSRSVYPMRL